MRGFYVHLIWFETPAESSNCLKTKTRIWQQQVFFQTSPSPSCSLIVGWLVLAPQSNLEKIETPTNYNFPPFPFSLSGFVVLHKLIEKSLALDLDNSKELIQTKKNMWVDLGFGRWIAFQVLNSSWLHQMSFISVEC